jgi:hypothetical protein
MNKIKSLSIRIFHSFKHNIIVFVFLTKKQETNYVREKDFY